MANEVTSVQPGQGSQGGFGGSTFTNYMSSMSNMLNFDWKSGVSAGYGMLYNSVPTPHSDLNTSNQDSANIRSGISQGLLNAGLQSGNPYLAAAGVAYGVIDKTGGFNDASMSLDSTSNAINKVGSIALPGAGWFLPSTKKFKRSQASRDMASGYSGFDDFASKVELDAGGKFLVGSSKINRNVDKAKMMDASISEIKANRDNDFDAMYSMTLNIGVGNQFALNGGYDATLTRAAKHGLKLVNLNWAKRLASGGDLNWAKFNKITAKPPTKNYFKDEALNVKLTKDTPEETNTEETPEVVIAKPEEPLIAVTPISPQLSVEIDLETLDWLNTLQLDSEGNYLVPENLYNEIMSDEKKRLHLEELGVRIKSVPDKVPNNVNIHDPRRVVSNKLGGSFNVIPDGALHKNKHHMEDAEGLTKKGIPVVTEENGELILLAEIERDEVILHLSLTEKLESMLKEYEEADSQLKKDLISINAGKLLVKELLHNTVDNTGLLAS